MEILETAWKKFITNWKFNSFGLAYYYWYGIFNEHPIKKIFCTIQPNKFKVLASLKTISSFYGDGKFLWLYVNSCPACGVWTLIPCHYLSLQVHTWWYHSSVIVRSDQVKQPMWQFLHQLHIPMYIWPFNSSSTDFWVRNQIQNQNWFVLLKACPHICKTIQ